MQIKIDDVSGLPEALKPLVEAGDDGSTLDLGKLAPSDELERFKAKALTAEGEAIERRKALAKWKELGETPDEVSAALKAKPKADPDQERMVEELRAQHAAELTGVREQLTQERAQRTMGDLKSELVKAGVIPDALDMAAATLASRIKFADDGAPQVYKDGARMVGSGKDGGATLGDLAKEFAGSAPFLVSDVGKGGSGKQATSGGTPGEKTVTRGQFDSMSQVQRAAFAKEGGKVVDA